MPYKVVGKCVHKLNADGSVGKIVPGGCHKSVGEAQAHKRALYANVKKEVAMSNSRVKRQAKREKLQKKRELEELQAQEAEDTYEELTPEEEALLLEGVSEDEDEEAEELAKEYGPWAEASAMSMAAGPTSFEELDDVRASEMKAGKIRQASWDVEDLVHNIIRSPMIQGSEKADYIKKVGTDFGERVNAIMNAKADMMKEHPEDMDVLEVEAILAGDERNKNLFEKTLGKLFAKRELSTASRKALSDSDFALVYEVDGKKVRKYPIQDKAHVRNALARAAQQLKAGGTAATDARKALSKIRAAAKRLGIGASMEKESSGIIIQKDNNGDWRWVGWPSNNFIDRSHDILTENAHKEYVDWWWKERPAFPVFTSMHAPGTARTYPVDFVGYENGFLVMSGKLTESEAAGLLRVQKQFDVGMSHTGWGIRDANDPRQIVMYRSFEVTDLPLEMADNPFTDMAVISKEAEMLSSEDQLKYLATLTNDEALAKEVLQAKTSMKQNELKAAGVESKEAAQDEAEETAASEEALTPDIQAIIEQVGKQFDIEGLNEAFTQVQATAEKVPLLEELVKQQSAKIQELLGEQDEKLAELISPPAGKRFAWSKERPSQSQETIVEGEEKEKLQKNQAGIPDSDDYWLSQATGTAPVPDEVPV